MLIASFWVQWTFVTQLFLFDRMWIFLSLTRKWWSLTFFWCFTYLFNLYFYTKLPLMHWNERNDWKSSSNKPMAHFQWSKCSAKRLKGRKRMQLPLRQWNKHPKQWRRFKKICMLINEHSLLSVHVRKFTEIICVIFRNIDQIQDIMDDVAEQLEVSNEMSDLISSPIGGGMSPYANYYRFSFYFCWDWICRISNNYSTHKKIDWKSFDRSHLLQWIMKWFFSRSISSRFRWKWIDEGARRFGTRRIEQWTTGNQYQRTWATWRAH